MFHLIAVAPLTHAAFEALLRKLSAEKHVVDVIQLRPEAQIALKSHHVKQLRDHSVVLEICYPNSSKVDEELETFYALADNVFRFSSGGSLPKAAGKCSNLVLSMKYNTQDMDVILPSASTLVDVAQRVGATKRYAPSCVNATCWMALRQAEHRRRRDGHLATLKPC